MISRRGFLGALAAPAILRATDALSCTCFSGTGPAASSSFLTADFTSPLNYPNGGIGQQVISQRIWGTSGGGIGDANFQIWTNSTFTSLLSQVNFGLYYFKNSGQQWWNSNLSVDTGVAANLVNNFYKADPLGISSVIIGTDFSQSPFTTTPTLWGQAMANLANYLANFTMPNGKKFPLIGMMGEDEPDCKGMAISTVASYYNALGPLLPSGVVLVGPNTCFENGGWSSFPTQVPLLGVYSWDTYVQDTSSGYTRPGDPTALNGFTDQPTRFSNDAAGASGNVSRKPNAFFIGGYNIDTACQAAPMNSYVGAIFLAWAIIQSINNSALPFMACMWDGFADGTCGMVTGSAPPDDQSGDNYYGVNSTLRLTPKAYMAGQGVHSVYGPRWQVPTNGSGMMTCAVTPASGRFGLMMVNQGLGNKSGTVALSHWPVNSTGNGTANVWQINTSQISPGIPGSTSTTIVSSGITGTINFPDPSVTIIYV